MIKIEDIITIAKQAGELLNTHFGKSLSINLKKDQTYVSDVDLASHKLICDSIAELYPRHCIISEEDQGNDQLLNQSQLQCYLDKLQKTDCLWVVDPLDGTSNFIHRFPYFCVCIACVNKINHSPFFQTTAAVVYNPCSQDLYYCQKGQGVFHHNLINDKLTKLKNFSHQYNLIELKKSFVACGFHRDHLIEGYADKYVEIARKAESSRRLGSAAIDISMVAKGVFQLFFDPNVRIWDFLAGGLFVKELGGEVLEYPHHLYNSYSLTSSFSSSSDYHQALEKLISRRGIICGTKANCQYVYDFFASKT